MDRIPAASKQRILLPLDGSFFSEQALPYAQAIGGSDAELIFLTVVPPTEEIRGLLGKVLLDGDEVRNAFIDGTKAELAKTASTWLGDSSDVRPMVEIGDASTEILATAEREQADLIVMASHGRGAIKRWAIGSVTDRVARTSTVPVMIVRPTEEIPAEPGTIAIERLVVPLDGSELAAGAVPVAGTLATRLGIPVALVTVSEIDKELSGAMTYLAAFSQEVYDELIAAGREKARAHLDDGMKTLQQDGVSVTVAVLDGAVAPAIEEFVAQHDLIVMTSHGRSGVRRWAIGSVAEKLVRDGTAPVLLVPSPRDASTALPNG